MINKYLITSYTSYIEAQTLFLLSFILPLKRQELIERKEKDR